MLSVLIVNRTIVNYVLYIIVLTNLFDWAQICQGLQFSHSRWLCMRTAYVRPSHASQYLDISIPFALKLDFLAQKHTQKRTLLVCHLFAVPLM